MLQAVARNETSVLLLSPLSAEVMAVAFSKPRTEPFNPPPVPPLTEEAPKAVMPPVA